MNVNTDATPRERIVETPVEAKQATNKPRGMPVVLVVSTVGAIVALWVVWAVLFSPG